MPTKVRSDLLLVVTLYIYVHMYLTLDQRHWVFSGKRRPNNVDVIYYVRGVFSTGAMV